MKNLLWPIVSMAITAAILLGLYYAGYRTGYSRGQHDAANGAYGDHAAFEEYIQQRDSKQKKFAADFNAGWVDINGNPSRQVIAAHEEYLRKNREEFFRRNPNADTKEVRDALAR